MTASTLTPPRKETAPTALLFTEAPPAHSFRALRGAERLLILRLLEDGRRVLESPPLPRAQASYQRDRFYHLRRQAIFSGEFLEGQLSLLVNRSCALVPVGDEANHFKAVIGPSGVSGRALYFTYEKLYADQAANLYPTNPIRSIP